MLPDGRQSRRALALDRADGRSDVLVQGFNDLKTRIAQRPDRRRRRAKSLAEAIEVVLLMNSGDTSVSYISSRWLCHPATLARDAPGAVPQRAAIGCEPCESSTHPAREAAALFTRDEASRVHGRLERRHAARPRLSSPTQAIVPNDQPLTVLTFCCCERKEFSLSARSGAK